MLHKSSALTWLRGLVVASALACSRETIAGPSALPGCEQTAHPDALALAKSDAVGAMQDVGNVTVVELSGDYARNLDAPRRQIAAKFFATHADTYDFVVVFTTFEFDTGNSTAFYTGIRNDTTGIGQPTFDLSSAYGSNGRLQGYIDMAALARYSFSPTSPTYHDAIDTLAHEIMHRWGVHVHFIDAAGHDSDELLGRDGAHWSYFVDSDASLLYGHDWSPQADGTFKSVDVSHRFSPLDLYLAGFASKEEVAPFALIREGTGGTPGDLPLLGAISGGHAEMVGIDRIIAAMGPRSPTSVYSQKNFAAAVILVKRPGETVPIDHLLDLERFRARFEQQIVAMTDGRASMRVFTQPRSGEVEPPAVLQGTGAIGTPGGVAGAIAWLEARQEVDGHWEDRPATAMRDTAAVLRAFEELNSASAAIPRARAWIAAQTTTNLDQQSWKLSETHTDEDADVLADARDPSGGYAIEPGWSPSNLDTSLVATALANHAQDPVGLASALQMLGTKQNADGSFGITAPGRGRLLPTLRTSVLLASQTDGDSATRLQHAASWIALRQATNGAMGSAQQTSLAETIETYAVMERLHLSTPFSTDGIRSYVRQAQQLGGDWGGSVYLTANAILAVGHNERPNLSLVGAPGVQPAQPHDGERITLKAIVTNNGNIPVAPTQLQWYDGDPAQSGVAIGGAVAVRNLAAGEQVETTQTWDTTARAGEHVLWVVVDATASVEEASEQDNKVQTVVTVLPPSSLPNLLLVGGDFVVAPSTITALPTSVQLSGQIHNIGTQQANAAKIRVYAKPDLSRALAEAVTDVAARSSAPLVMNFTATQPTALNLVVRADPDNDLPESSETDNELEILLPFGDSLDLEVTSGDLSVTTDPLLVGRLIEFELILHNLGTTDSPPATLHVDVEQDGTTETIFNGPLQIAAGQRVQRKVEWTPTRPGAAQLRVVLDPAGQIPEGNEGNNNAQLDFVVSALAQADLTFTSGGLQFEPNPALEGESLTATLGVRNLSSVATGEFHVALYAQDPQLGSAPLAATAIASLSGSETATVTIHVPRFGLVGDQRLFAKIDADDEIAEIDETNNAVVGPIRSVPLPDISISVADIALSPPLPHAGDIVHATVTVRNLGGQDAHDIAVRLLEGDVANGSVAGADQQIALLRSGASATVEWSWTLGIVPNARSVTAIADPNGVVVEGNKENNIASLPFDVQDGNFFASERYISPNGDGVQDAAVVVFRMDVEGDVEVDVVNGAAYTVRHFTAVSLNDALRGQIIWDGRDDRRQVVPDGDYRVVIAGAEHQGLGDASITVDNNRSSLLEAVGTLHGIDGVLPGNFGGFRIPPVSSPKRDEVLAFWNPDGRGEGLLRSDKLFTGSAAIISPQWLARFRDIHGFADIGFDDFAFSPDGADVVVGVHASTGGDATTLLFRAAVDQSDSPIFMGALAGIAFPRVLGYFDQQTIVVGPDSAGMLQLVDATSYEVTAWRPLDAMSECATFEVITLGILCDGDNGEGPSRFLPRNIEKPIIDLQASPGSQFHARLSPERRVVAVREKTAQADVVELADLGTGARTLLMRSDQPAPQGVRYGLAWLERQDRLVVQDSMARTVSIFSEAGQRTGTVQMSANSRIGDYANDDQDPPGHSTAETIFPDGPPDLVAADCSTAPAELGAERRIFDPTTNRLLLGLRELVRVSTETNEGPLLVYTTGISDYFSVDVDAENVESVQTGTFLPLFNDADKVQHPLRQHCDGAPPAEWPQLILSDGARISMDGRVQTLSHGRSTESWMPPGNPIVGLWPDESRALFADHRTFVSLLNLNAIIEARTLGRGIELSGVAADRNFAHYRLDWSPIEESGNWRALTPTSTDEVFLDEFLTWVPPQPGTFLIRLTVVDKAGNSASAYATASSFDRASVDNFALTPRYVSPNGDGVQDELAVKYRVLQPVTLTLSVADSNGVIVRSTNRTYGTPNLGPDEYDWDGRDDSGRVVADGRYRVGVDGFSAWVTVDTSAPSLDGSIQQAYQRFETCDAHSVCRGRVSVDPWVYYLARDAHIRETEFEWSSIGGNEWRAIVWPSRVPMPPWLFAQHAFRVKASDLAGNSSSKALGQADEVLILQAATNESRFAAPDPPGLPQSAIFDYQEPPFAVSPDLGGWSPIPVDRSAEDSVLLAWNFSTRLTDVAVEMAAAETPDQWIERGRYGLDGSRCSSTRCVTGNSSGLHVPLDAAGLSAGSHWLVRLRGERDDGTRLYSNRGYLRIGGIDAPVCGAASGPNQRVTVRVREYFEGPLAQATLHYFASGVERVVPADSIDDDGASFNSVDPDVNAWIVAIDGLGLTHKSPVGLIHCSGDTSHSSGWTTALRRHPVIRDACDGLPSHQIQIEPQMEWRSANDGEPEPNHLRLSYVNGFSSEEVIVLDEDVDAHEWSSRPPQRFSVSTDSWPIGTYDSKLIVGYVDGTSSTRIIQLPVVTQAPTVGLLTPTQGEHVCTSPASSSGSQQLSISASIHSEVPSSYRIGLGAGQHPLSFDCRFAKGEVEGGGATSTCQPYELLSGFYGESTEGDHADLDGTLGAYNGIATLQMKGLNWSGGTVCAERQIYLDSAVELSESSTPQTRLPWGVAGQWVLGIAPNGSPRYSVAKLSLRSAEPLRVEAVLRRAHFDAVNNTISIDPEIVATLMDVDGISSDFDVTWNGVIGGTSAQDGIYDIEVSAHDACSHSYSVHHLTLVDSTTPSIAITAPVAGSVVSTSTVEIAGTSNDSSGIADWSLDFAVASSSDAWQNIASGTGSVPLSRVLKSWSRGSLTGVVDLRLSASDGLGNRSETHVPITLGDAPRHLGSAELQPPLFSPNADAVLDATRLQVSLLSDARVEIHVTNSANATVTSLYADASPLSAGTHAFQWSGRDVSGLAVPDGDYRVVISVTDPLDGAPPEVATLGASIDTVRPVLEIRRPSGSFTAAESIVELHIDDEHLVAYDATLKRVPDGVLIASTSGTHSEDVLLAELASQPEGSYAVHIGARDGAGNVATKDTVFQLDTTLPAVTLVDPADHALIASSATVSVKGSIDDEHLDAYTLSVAADGTEEWTELTRGVSNLPLGEIVSWRPNLADGAYKIRLRASDLAGNRTDVSHSVDIDGTAPVAYISAPVDGGFLRANGEIQGTATDAHFAGYRMAIATAAQSASGQWSEIYAGTAPVDAGRLASLSLSLPEDAYQLRLVVTDLAGLSSSDIVHVRIDAQAPAAPGNLVGHVEQNRSSVLSWSAVSAEDLAGYVVYRDDEPIAPGAIASTQFVDEDPPEGTRRYAVRAIDRAGNESVASNAVSLLIDHTAPLASILRPIAGERVRGVYDVAGTAFSSGDFKQYRVTQQLLDPPGVVEPLASGTLSVHGRTLATWNTLATVDESRVRLHLDAEDVLGNVAGVDVDVVVDNAPPAAPAGLVATLDGADARVHWDPNSESDLLGYLLYRDSQLVNATLPNLPADLRPFALSATQYIDEHVPDGQHGYVLYAIDRAGNVSPPSPMVALDPLDNAPPSMTIESPVSGTRFETSVTILATSRDSDIEEVRFAYRAAGATGWVDLGSALTVAPYRITWTPAEGIPYDSYEVRALARDSGGRSDPTPPVVQLVYADLTPPPAPTNLIAHADGSTVRLAWNISVAQDLSGYRIYRDGSVSGDVTAPASMFDDEAQPDGEHSYEIRAVDAFGNESLPSNEARAVVFGITVEQPFTPTEESGVLLSGMSARPGAIVLHIENAEGQGDSTLGTTSSTGVIALQPINLVLGGNDIVLRVVDAEGNTSKPAEIWMDRGAVPAAPRDATAVVNDHSILLSWSASPEPDVNGYRVFRNNQAVDTDDLLGEALVATANDGSDANAAVDGDLQTYWEGYDDGVTSQTSTAPSFELGWVEQRIVAGANLTWSPLSDSAGNVDLFAWSGHVWVRVAHSMMMAGPTQFIVLDKPYRTDRLRLVCHSEQRQATFRLAEIQLQERVLQGATNFAESVLDGSWRYQVSAVNELAFESSRSNDVVVGVGDTEGPGAVVLSGQLSGNQASLTWTMSGSADVVSYELNRDGVVIASVNVGEPREYVDQGLTIGPHEYLVHAYDAIGNEGLASNSVVLLVDGDVPEAPLDLALSAPAAGGALDASWRAAPGTTPAHYVLRRALATTGPFETIAEPVTSSYHDAPLANGTTYYYSVASVDIVGNASAPSVIASGVPRDRVPPPRPALTYPTNALDGVTTLSASTDVCGTAEAGASVVVERSDTVLLQATASSAYATEMIPLGNQNAGSLALPAPDGRHIAIDDGGIVRVFDSRNSVEHYESVDNAWLHGWAAHGGAIYYGIYGTDELYRWEPGHIPEAIAHPVTSMGAFAANAGETEFAIGGVYAPDGTAPVDAVWLVKRTNAIARRIGDFDPAALMGQPVWAPDSKHVLLVGYDGVVRVVDVETATVVETLPMDVNVQIAWAGDGSRFAYADWNALGGDDLMSFDISTHMSSTLAQHVGAIVSLAWSPEGEMLGVLDAQSLDIVDSRTGISELVLPYANADAWQLLMWTASGRLAAIGHNSVFFVDMPSWFCATSAPLVAGTNLLSARATDSSGNHGFPSASIEVDASIGELPDLALATTDVFLVPPVGIVGQDIAVILTLHNQGAASVAEPDISVILVSPIGTRSVLAASTLPSLAAGASESVSYVTGPLSMAGTYLVEVQADPYQRTREVREDNNTATVSLTIAESAQAVLELNLTRSVYAPDEAVVGDVSVANPGISFTGHVNLEVLDSADNTVADLNDTAIESLGFGQQWRASLAWNTQGIVAGAFRVRARLYDSNEALIGERFVAFAIEAAHRVELSLSADPTTQNIGSSVTIRSELAFVDGNSPLDDAELHVTVSDAANVELWRSDHAVGTLLPGYVIARSDVWPTLGRTAGVYTLKLELSAADYTASTTTALSLVSPTDAASLRGSISFEPGTTLVAGQDTSLHWQVSNSSMSALNGVQTRMAIVKAPDQSQVVEIDDSFDLAVGQSREATTSLTAPPLALASHTAILEARLPDDAAGQWRVLAQQGFAVVDRLPPQIVILSPLAGSVQPAVVPLSAAIHDAHSLVVAAEVSVDGSTWQPLSAGPDGLYARGLGGLIDGSHSLEVRARDSWGNQMRTVPSSFEVDATAPAVTITGVADGDAINHSVAPEVAINDAHLSSSDIRLNNALFTSGTAIGTDGAYVLIARAGDEAGNQTTRSVRFVIDSIAPSVAIISPSDGSIVTHSVVRVDIQTEAAASVDLATGSYQATAIADSQGRVAFEVVPLVGGSNHVEARARDQAGNVGGPTSIDVVYEPTATVPLLGTLQPAVTDLAAGAPLAVHVDAQNPNETSLAAQHLRVQVLASANAVLATQTLIHDFSGHESYTTDIDFESIGWPLGVLTIELDLAQDSSWVPLDAKQINVVDLTPPLLILDAPADSDVLRSPITLHASASDSLTGVASVESRIDAGEWLPLAEVSPGAYESDMQKLSDGDHQIAVRAQDGAGNLAAPDPVHVAIDTVAPLINIGGVGDGDLVSHALTPTIDISDAHLLASDIRLNDVPFISGTTIATSGDYRLDVFAADAAGNNETVSLQFTIDLEAPSVAFTSPAPDTIVTGPSVDVVGFTEALSQVHLATTVFSTDTKADASGRFEVVGVSLQPGTNLIAAHATDRAGNVGTEANLTVTYEAPHATVAGQIGALASPLLAGAAIDVPYAVQNTGDVDLPALELRLEMRSATGADVLVSDVFLADLPSGGVENASRALATSTLPPGDYVLAFSANLSLAEGFAWTLLDTVTATLVAPQCQHDDVILIDGFDGVGTRYDDRIFCNGFDRATAIARFLDPQIAPWVDVIAWVAKPSLRNEAASRQQSQDWNSRKLAPIAQTLHTHPHRERPTRMPSSPIAVMRPKSPWLRCKQVLSALIDDDAEANCSFTKRNWRIAIGSLHSKELN